MYVAFFAFPGLIRMEERAKAMFAAGFQPVRSGGADGSHGTGRAERCGACSRMGERRGLLAVRWVSHIYDARTADAFTRCFLLTGRVP